MARQFQGYARGRGFSSRSPGAGAVSRIQEQGNKTVQGLKEQLQSKRQQDQQYASDLNSNFRRGQAINEEIKRFEDKAFNVKMSNVRQNQQRSLDNIKAEAANQATLNKQLSEFSKTLGDSVTDTIETIEKVEAEASAITLQLNGAFLPSDDDDALEDELRKQSTKSENEFAQISQENGLPDDVRQQQRASDPYRNVKDVNANIEGAWDDYSREATYDNYGPGLAREIFKRRGLIGVNARRFKSFATRYEKLNSAYDTKNRKARAVNISAELGSKADAQMLNNLNEQTLMHAFQTHKNGTEKGDGPRNNTLATDHIFELLGSNSITIDQAIQVLKATHLVDEDGNKLPDTFFTRHEKGRVAELIRKKEDSISDAVDRREDLIKAEQKQNYLDALEAVDQLGEVADPAPYIAELDDVDLSKEQRNLLSERITDNSKYGKEQKNVDRQLQYAYDNGQPMDQIFLQAKGKTRNKWKSIVAEVKNGMQAAGVSDTENRKRLLKQGKLRLNVQSIDKIYDSSLDYATDDRLASVQKRRQELMRLNQMDYASANTQAMGEEIDKIDNSNLPEYKPEGATTGNGSTHNYYGYYSPNGGYFTNVVQANTHQALQAVRARPESIEDVFLAPTSYYAGVYDSIQKNKPIPESRLFNELHKAYPEALQLQLNKYTTENGLPPVTIPLTQNQYLAANAEDPRLKQFALRMDTIQEERIYPLAADKATQMGISLMSPGVQTAYQNMATTAFDTGAVVGDISIDGARRAIVGNESGNNFRAVNPHSGALGFAQVMPSNVGPWSQEILGRTVSQQEFLNNPSVQMAIINGKLQKYFQQEAAKGFTGEVLLRRVASIWYSGQADLYDNATDEYYDGHKYPSIRNYTKDIAKRYRSGQ